MTCGGQHKPGQACPGQFTGASLAAAREWQGLQGTEAAEKGGMHMFSQGANCPVGLTTNQSPNGA